MSAANRRIVLLTSAVFILSACSTVQENPNYQYSSKYGVTDKVQTAQVVEPIQDTSPSVVNVSSPGEAVSPTEQAYNADAMTGTPGYAILVAEENEQAARSAPQPAALPVPEPVYGAPREVAYDYGQNVIISDAAERPAPAAQSPAPTRTAVTATTGQSYVVRPGDTVYSLSRRFCAPISEIVTANGIGADYSIAIGQTLTMPAARC